MSFDSSATQTGGKTEAELKADRNTLIGIGCFIAALVPVVSITAWLTWLIFSVGRVKRSVIASFLALYSVILVLITPLVNPIGLYILSWTVGAPTLIQQITAKQDFVSTLILILVRQAPVSIVIGGVIGLLYASHAWSKKADWEETKFRLTPKQWYIKRKNIKDIQSNKNSPTDGVTLGIAKNNGTKIIQSDRQAAAHTLIFGASGTGKTTTILNMARDMVKRGHGVVIVDLKGGPDIPARMKELADREEKTFRHWTMHPENEEYTGPSEMGPAYYDPIARGEATRRKDLLMAIHEWNEPYYKVIAEEYLQKVFTILIANPNKELSTIEDVASMFELTELTNRANKLINNPQFRSYVEEIGRMNDEKQTVGEKSAIYTLKGILRNLIMSTAGPWLKKDPKNLNNINLMDVAHNSEIVVFSLDSANYEVAAAIFGNLIIQDLKTVTSELRKEPAPYPIHVIIDEFAAISSNNVIQLVNKARDANMPVVLATQTLGDLRAVSDSFTDQLLGVVNAFIIHRANTLNDAKDFAGITGLEIKKKFRQSVEHSSSSGFSQGSGTGSGTIEEVEDFIVPIKVFQELQQGEMVWVSKSPQLTEIVKVIPENTALAVATGDKNKRVAKPAAVQRQLMLRKEEMKHDIFDDVEEVPLYEDEDPMGIYPPAPVINQKPSDPERLKKIFNRPPDEFLPRTEPSVQKHHMPPQKSSDSPRISPPKNLNPPLFEKTNPRSDETQTMRQLPPKAPQLPSRKAALPKRPVMPSPIERPVRQAPAVPPKVVRPTAQPEDIVKPTKPVFPPKDKFDF